MCIKKDLGVLYVYQCIGVFTCIVVYRIHCTPPQPPHRFELRGDTNLHIENQTVIYTLNIEDKIWQDSLKRVSNGKREM